MVEFTEHLLDGFRAGLKEAGIADAIARAAPRLRAAGSLAGVGALAGGAAGAGLSASKAYHEAKGQGAGVLGAGLHGLAGSVGGAVRGATAGALGGAALGSASGLGRSLSARTGTLGAAARFGERQVHSLAGHLNPAELESVGGGAADARAAYKAVEDKAIAHAATPGGAFSDHAGQLQKAEKGLKASERTQEMGLTSIPGYLRSMKDNGVGSTLAAGVKDQWHNTSPAMGALMIGAPALGAAATLAKKENPNGPGKGEELGRNIGGLVGGVAGSAMPLVGNMVAGGVGAAVGGQVGKGADWMRRRRQPLPMLGGKAEPEQAEGQHIPSERVMSPAAAGQSPEVGL